MHCLSRIVCNLPGRMPDSGNTEMSRDMKQKAIKLFRRYRWSFTSKPAVPVIWHVGRPNFGDDINPWLWEKLLGKPVLFGNRDRPHLLGMGSILEKNNKQSIIAGSGLIQGLERNTSLLGQVVAVRGYLTAEHIGVENCLLGDPAVLLNHLFPQTQTKDFLVGLIPHASEVGRFRRINLPEVHLIDPRWDPLRVLNEICRCRNILSQSLHGLIAADSYGIPNAWLEPSSSMIGGEFKFLDYYSTTDFKKSPVSWVNAVHCGIESLDYKLSTFLHPQTSYSALLKNAIAERCGAA